MAGILQRGIKSISGLMIKRKKILPIYTLLFLAMYGTCMSQTIAIRSAQFTDSIGVNVHLEYTDGKYANVESVLSNLSYIGVKSVRDGMLNPLNQGQANYDTAAAAGIKFDLVYTGSTPDLDKSLALAQAFLARHPGAISAIEGANEVNNWPISYAGLTGNAAAQAFQAALASAVDGKAALADIPVYNLTSWPDLAGKADYANFHSYALNGDQPYARMLADYTGQMSTMAGKPIVLTEAGYSTSTGINGVDEQTQAKLTINLLLDASKLGVAKVYLYELLDAYSDPAKADYERNLGLFDYANNAKPVAVAIHNLNTILADTGATAATFELQSMDYTLSGASAATSSMLYQKSSGAMDIVIWNERDIWDQVAHKSIAVAAETIKVSLDATYDTVKIYDPLASAEAVTVLHNVSSVTLDVTDHAMIIEVSGKIAAKPAVVTSLTGTINADVLVCSGAVTTLNGDAGSDILTGGASADTLNGGSGSDTLDGKGGSDVMVGGTGDDSYVIDNAGDVVTELAGEGLDTVKASISWTLGANVENLDLWTTGNLNGAGNDLDNTINGNSGKNILEGGAGADFLVGGDGDDQLFGGAGDDRLTGNNGSDTLNGGAGADRLSGGAGADVFVFGAAADFGSLTTSDIIGDFNAAEGDRLDLTALDANSLVAGVQHFSFIGASAFTKTAGQLRTQVSGGDIILSGDVNGDGAADFRLVVHTGSLTASDFVTNSLAVVPVSGALSSLAETVTNVISGTLGADNLIGTTASDILKGFDGADVLEGRAGADTMIGGLGDDRYIVDNIGDVVTELANQGTDIVRSSVNWTLGANIENLDLTGSAVKGVGNDLDNTINGNSGNNILEGGAGADFLVGGDGDDQIFGGAGDDRLTGNNGVDILVGGAGADRFSGGAGADTFVFQALGDLAGNSGYDVINDFTRADGDRIDLRMLDADSVHAGDQAFTWIGNSAFSHTASELRYDVRGGDLFVTGDLNGDGAADFGLPVHTTSLLAQDFFL